MTIIDDTIAAISTPLGEAGIGIVRLSGKDAIPIAEKLFSSSKNKTLSKSASHKINYGFIKDPSTDSVIDEVLVSVMRAPNTYTREDVVEINCHGGMLPLRNVLELVLKHGARLAEPGEFTKRAFLNGRIDLSQAEAVMDLIASRTDESRKIALEQLSGGLSEKITSLRDRIADLCAHIEAYIDFPEEDIEPALTGNIQNEIDSIHKELSQFSASFEEGRFFREGLRVAIVGRPNVGKSSLLNAFLQRDRAIVTEMPGTTRDVLEEYLNIKGLPVRIMDTAGIRETHEMAEKEGVARSLSAIDDADLIIAVVDGSAALHEEDFMVLEKVKDKKFIAVMNKCDLPMAKDAEKSLSVYSKGTINISAKTEKGLDELKDRILDAAFSGRAFSEAGGVIITNVRHKTAVDNAIKSLDNAAQALKSKQPLEIAAMEMRDSLDRLGEIVGAVTTEDILNRIFSEFCIGK